MRKVHIGELCNMCFSPKLGSESIIMLLHIHVICSMGNSEKFSVETSERFGMQGRICTKSKNVR